MRLASLVALASLAACGGGGGTDFSHDDPGFTAKVPGDLERMRDMPLQDGGRGGSVSLRKMEPYEEVFFIWVPTGEPTDPVPQFGRHKQHEDLTKIIEEKDLPGGGKFIQIDRGGRIFTHSVITSGGYGIECTVSWPADKPARPELADACKTLAPK